MNKEQVVGMEAVFREHQKMDHFGNVGIMLAKEVRNIGLGTKMMEIIIKWVKTSIDGLEYLEIGVISKKSLQKSFIKNWF